jgi:hypothetical protein
MIHRRRSVGKTRTRHGQTTRRHAERTLHTYTHDERAGAREGQDAVHIHTRRKVRERESERERGGGWGWGVSRQAMTDEARTHTHPHIQNTEGRGHSVRTYMPNRVHL